MTRLHQVSIFGRRRINPVRQAEQTDCSLAVVTMIANYLGHDIDSSNLRSMYQPSSRGTTVGRIVALLDGLQISARVLSAPAERLDELALPVILHWNHNHFVVLEAIGRRGGFIHDPNGISRWFAWDELRSNFSGVAIECRPSPRFEPVRQRARISIMQLWSRITALGQFIVQTILLSVIIQVISLAAPYYMQIAVDSVLPAHDRDLLVVLAFVFGAFGLFSVLATLLRSFVLLSAGTNLGFGVASNVARHLLQLPISWFERRHVGDVLSRFQSIAPIRQFLTQGAIAGALDGIFAFSTLALMFFYSALLSSITLIVFLLFVATRALYFPAQKALEEAALIKASEEQSTMIETIRGIVTLRLFNSEIDRHTFWQGKLSESLYAAVRATRLSTWQSSTHEALFLVESTLITFLAIVGVMNGELTLGMVFAFLAYKAMFLARAASLVDQWMKLRMLSLHLDRLSEIALAKRDLSFDGIQGGAALDGQVEVRGVGFRYGPDEPWVFRDLNLKVSKGEHVAITGPSGGGKTTLINILLGLSEPVEGEVAVDKIPLTTFGYQAFRQQIAAVLQDDHLFAGSLLGNITFFDAQPDLARVESAVRASGLKDEVASMSMGLNTLVGDMGSSLSGGQKQRVLLARALYRQPRILFLDEGTSHLDPERESFVNQSIADLGITKIVVAHRRETILRADRILVLKDKQLRDITAEMKGRLDPDFPSQPTPVELGGDEHR
jgi:ATP-binding cassette, subfamily B, bacterial CvaB/MchF/RaxB